MNILLTGATGFLGKAIFDVLNENHQLSTLSRNIADYQICLETEIPVFFTPFELVVHCAGKAHSVPKTDFEKKQFYDVNVTGTINLLEGLKKSGLPNQFIFISSVSVYGQEIGSSINENHSLDAKDAYGLSKIKAEKVVLDWCEENKVICTILRLPLLIGKNPPGNLGTMIKAINKGYYFNIDGGKAKKSMVLAKDVASFITIVAPVGGIYNLTDGIHPDFFQLSLAISNRKTFSLPLSLAKLIGKIGDVFGDNFPVTSLKIKKITSELTFDDTKARELLNWRPEEVLVYLMREKYLNKID